MYHKKINTHCYHCLPVIQEIIGFDQEQISRGNVIEVAWFPFAKITCAVFHSSPCPLQGYSIRLLWIPAPEGKEEAALLVPLQPVVSQEQEQ